MPDFAFTARDAQGQTVRDTVAAPSRREALRMLAARGLQPLDLAEPGAPAAAAAAERAVPAVAPQARDLLPFLRALAELTASGLSSGEAVRLLAQRIKEPRLRTLCGVIWDGLKEGLTLSHAMETVPAVFDTQTISLVRAGEATGGLTEVLERLIKHLSERRDLRDKLMAALAYPILVSVVAVGVVIFFVFFLMPRLQGLLASLGGRLPLSTQILVTSSEWLVRYGVIVVPGLALAGLIFWRWHRTPAGRAAIDAQVLRLPVLRGWSIENGVLVFVQTLAVLLENGINTVEALLLTERTVPNLTMRAALRAATERVLEGDSLSTALGRTGYFPDLVLDRLAVGENTGRLTPCLRDLAAHYSRRYTLRVQRLVGIVANGVLMAVFAFVGYLAFAIVAAVLRVSASFQF